mgnify:CR=1 FL=1
MGDDGGSVKALRAMPDLWPQVGPKKDKDLGNDDDYLIERAAKIKVQQSVRRWETRWQLPEVAAGRPNQLVLLPPSSMSLGA